jgi:hypothetical protein
VTRWLLALALASAPLGAKPLPTLRWTGTARVYDADRTIDIAVDTQVTPFATALSKSWIVAEGPARARVLLLTPTSGTVTFLGKSRPLGEAQARHERAQFALYGLMLTTRARNRCVVARHADAPEARLCFDRTGRLTSGASTVPDSETGAPLAQTFEFSGEIRSGPVRWPRTLLIRHGGKPYFQVTLDSFEARPARG